MSRRLPEAHALEGPWRSIAAAAHGFAIARELELERLLDRRAPAPPTEEPLLRRCTALIKTFERPRVVRRLVASIRRRYPSLAIIVADDSHVPVALDGVITVAMPYDSGVAAGRNEALARAHTEYVVMLDDDYVFFRGTRLGSALKLMEEHPEIDIMGGRVIELPLRRRRRLPEGEIFTTPAVPRTPLGSQVAGLRVVDKVPTFFVARRERLRLVGWDPRLKRTDHADFFTRALGTLTTVFNPDLECLHARTPFDRHYMRKRMDLAESLEILEERYGG